MKVSVRAKERFCKDCNIPIRLFEEPYFMDRLNLYDKFYATLEKWEIFLEELGKYPCEQDYFEEYNRVKDEAIFSIKDSAAYQRFNGEDMNQFQITHKNLPHKDIFKAMNDGRRFISIDIKKANFSCLRHYDESMFRGAATWEDFIRLYTDNQHIVNSKYIRQVILGNCNPKRHITYEKYLMDKVLTCLTEEYIPLNKVVFFSNDEIVADISDMDEAKQQSIASRIHTGMENMPVPLKTEMFVLHKIEGISGYYKEILKVNGQENEREEIEFKCLDSLNLPFVIRCLLGEEITENDKVFCYEGRLAKFIEAPKLSVRVKN